MTEDCYSVIVATGQEGTVFHSYAATGQERSGHPGSGPFSGLRRARRDGCRVYLFSLLEIYDDGCNTGRGRRARPGVNW